MYKFHFYTFNFKNRILLNNIEVIGFEVHEHIDFYHFP